MESRIDALLAQEGLDNPNAPAPSYLETQAPQEDVVAHEEDISPPLEHIESHEDTQNVSRETSESEPEEQSAPESQVDDYGNEVPMENAAIRERLSKQAKRYEQEMAKMREEMERLKQQSHQPEQPNMQNNDDWEAQLEQFIDQRLTARERAMQEDAWRKQQQAQQAQFEIKFNEGAAKYADFESVVMGKPITPEMVLATQDMADPAAFIYAAAKTQAKELERISQIRNPYTQAVELGKLDERMRKARANTSSAPKPISRPKGDVTDSKIDKDTKSWSIDEKIRYDEHMRLKSRR